MIILPKCPKCGEEKELNQFKYSRHGTILYCLNCAPKHNTTAISSLREIDGRLVRECSNCRILKDLEMEFNKSSSGTFGYHSWCKKCSSTAKKEYGYRKADLKKNFGITIEQYNLMLASQGNICAICRKPCKTGNNLAVDHDHNTKVVRGLLCTKCNTAIGLLDEDEDIIWNMMEYLKKHVWKEVA